MSEKVFPQLSGYRPLRRRRTATLCKWATALNYWKWPADIAKLTERPAPNERDGFYSIVMNEILLELGFRAWINAREVSE